MSNTSRAITRRQFTAESVLALLAGVTITIGGCGSDSSSMAPTAPTATPTPPVAGGQPDIAAAISDNHGHIAAATGAEITAANTVTVNIQGNATHPHNITLTGNQLRSIGARQRVEVSSTNNVGHDHTVTFN